MLEAVAAPIPPLSGGDAVPGGGGGTAGGLSHDRPDELLSLLDTLGRLNHEKRNKGERMRTQQGGNRASGKINSCNPSVDKETSEETIPETGVGPCKQR